MLGEQAVFKDCITEASPYNCTVNRFKTEIAALITPQFTAALKEEIGADYFSVSIILLIDENGKVVEEETDILCHYKPLEEAIRTYLYNLPDFYPKDTKQKDRRSVYVLNYVFLYNLIQKSYVHAPKNVLSTSQIKPEILPPDSYPTYEDCKFQDAGNDKCFSTTITKLITKKMRYPRSDEKNKEIKLLAYLTISKTGDVTLDRVEGDEDNYFYNELTRLIKKLPKPEPARIRGIAVASSYKMPLTIRLNTN